VPPGPQAPGSHPRMVRHRARCRPAGAPRWWPGRRRRRACRGREPLDRHVYGLGAVCYVTGSSVAAVEDPLQRAITSESISLLCSASPASVPRPHSNSPFRGGATRAETGLQPVPTGPERSGLRRHQVTLRSTSGCVGLANGVLQTILIAFAETYLTLPDNYLSANH